MIGIGLIGCGNWGFNYIKTLNSIPEAKILYVCDVNIETLKKVRLYYPHLNITKDYRDLLKDEKVDGVIIATPPPSHFSMAANFIKGNKAVLVEKPITLSYSDADKLITLAQQNNTHLMVGHLMEYHPVVVKLHEYIHQGILGEIRYISSERTSLSQHRSDVLWDLAVHDLSIVRYLVNKNPVWVSAQGKSYLQDNVHDLITITMEFPGNLFVQIHANSIYPKKKRQTVVAGDKSVVIVDDIKEDFKLQLVHYKGDIIMPNLEKTLPLTSQCKHFIDCVKSDSTPKTGTNDISWVMKVIDLTEQSLKQNGKRIYFTLTGGENDEYQGL